MNAQRIYGFAACLLAGFVCMLLVWHYYHISLALSVIYLIYLIHCKVVAISWFLLVCSESWIPSFRWVDRRDVGSVFSIFFFFFIIIWHHWGLFLNIYWLINAYFAVPDCICETNQVCSAFYVWEHACSWKVGVKNCVLKYSFISPIIFKLWL